MRALTLLAPALMVVVAKRETSAPGAGEVPRIIGGQPAEPGQFPYQASIISDRRYLCGGSLITNSKVLTAAHCTHTFKEFIVRLGGIYMDTWEVTAWSVVTPYALNHWNYDRVFLRYDVAIVFLVKLAPLSSHINMVVLPSVHEIQDSYAGETALISGWGRTSDTSEESTQLRWANMTVISNAICSIYYAPALISETTLCATDEESGICVGDAGGALVLKTSRSYRQIGVNSFVSGLGCEAPAPNVFARITSVLDWIDKMASDRVY